MTCVVAIYSLDGALAGTGTIVSETFVLSCAHVVNAGLRRKLNATERPRVGDRLLLRFAGAPGQLRFAEVAPGSYAWSPPPASGAAGADLCLLSLSEPIPVGAEVGRINPAIIKSDLIVTAIGYPSDWNKQKNQPQLDFARALILGRDGYLWLMRADQGAWIAALNENKRSAGLIYNGFSGGPVLADDSILGLIVEARQNVKEATAYFIPAYAFPAEILELQRAARSRDTNRRKLEVIYESGPVILNKEHLCTLSIFYDHVLLPYIGDRETFLEFRRERDSYKLSSVAVSFWTDLGDILPDIVGEDRKHFRANDIPMRWDQVHTELFQAGALGRLGPPEHAPDDHIFESPERFEAVAARFDSLDLVFITGFKKRRPDLVFIPASHVFHLLRDDLSSPGIFLPRNRRWREIAKAVMAHAAITYMLPKLSSMPLQEILRIRSAVSDTREGFAMYLQELTAQVDDAIKSGETLPAVTRYSETVVEARLIPAYREYIRQIEDVSTVGGHFTSGMVEVSAALPNERLTNEILKALGISSIGAIVSRATNLTNRNQAFQFMRTIERGRYNI
jgi:hypothetical protein